MPVLMSPREGNTSLRSPKGAALDRVNEQEEWIEECGGDLEGYVRKYGSINDPEHYGDGGEAIYQADLDALTTYVSQLADVMS